MHLPPELRTLRSSIRPGVRHASNRAAKSLGAVFAALVSCLLFSACSGYDGAPQPGDTAFVRDSAGIRIVQSRDSAWTTESRWTVSSSPDLQIGSVDGGVRGTGFGGPLKITVPGEGIAVLDRQSNEIRLFDAGGSLERVVGGRGSGPSEFQGLTIVQGIRGDSIAAWDQRLRKLVVFPRGEGVPRVPTLTELPSGEWWDWRLVGVLADGRFVVEARRDPRTRRSGPQVESATLLLLDADGE